MAHYSYESNASDVSMLSLIAALAIDEVSYWPSPKFISSLSTFVTIIDFMLTSERLFVHAFMHFSVDISCVTLFLSVLE